MSLLRTAEIGDSQKTTQRVPAHAMKHVSDTACIEKKAEIMLCAHVTFARAHAAMHAAASWSGVPKDTFAGENEKTARGRVYSAYRTCQTIHIMLHAKQIMRIHA